MDYDYNGAIETLYHGNIRDEPSTNGGIVSESRNASA